MIWLRLGAWLGLAVLTTGCEAVLGAEFGDFGRFPDDAAVTLPDADPPADASAEWPPSDPSDVGAPEAGPVDEIDAANEVALPPVDGGGVTGCVHGMVNPIGECGNCGRFLQICNDGGTWDPHFCQQEDTACAPGLREQRSCEGNGTLTAICSDRCMWQLGQCMQSNCMPNQVDEQPCGFCGKQIRTCQAVDGGGWQWTPFSNCMQQKLCAPETIERDTCGNCGTRSRLCEAACTWGPWSTCEGEGECAAGSQQEMPCILVLGRQIRVCSDQCKWGMWMCI